MRSVCQHAPQACTAGRQFHHTEKPSTLEHTYRHIQCKLWPLNTQIGPSLTGVPDDLIVSPGFEAPRKVESEEVAVQTDDVYISDEPPAASPTPI